MYLQLVDFSDKHFAVGGFSMGGIKFLLIFKDSKKKTCGNKSIF